MTTAEYLSAVLKSQALAEDSSELKTLRAKRKDVEYLIKKSFEERNPTIRYGGSYAKGTLIRENYDLDLTCYFAHDDDDAGDNLKDIYNNVVAALADSYFVERKTSAIRLKGKVGTDVSKVDFHIDVVPGRFTDASRGDVFIHQEGVDKERQKTNLDVHLDYIRGSGVTDAIKLVKLWKVRHWLNLKTFVLELMVIKAIGTKKEKPIATQLQSFWQEVVDAQGNIVVEDPANPSGNDLSGMNNAVTQLLLTNAANQALASIEADRWQDIFGPVEETSDVAKAAALAAPNIVGAGRTKPWAPGPRRG